MAKRRSSTEDGQYQVESPEDVKMEGTDLDGGVQEIAPESTPELETVVEADPKAPVELELRVGSTENVLPEKLSKEKIETSVKEKLARKTDSTDSNPFIPQTHLENEVKEIARAGGFPLSRGTEVGARLLARSKRRDA